ncbi:MAG TPA: trypsin-like peptidase domain-containing protein [Thermoguttaceae bacterium]|nr:trypsin-like peptidase domain-containing protein [Thermoguttaceae bacterium]
MKKTVLLCIVSAGAGAVLSAMLMSPSGISERSVAQESSRGPDRVTGTPASPSGMPGPPAASTVASVWPVAAPIGEEDLTPEERVNIAVYEQVNRSVVNIDTASVRRDAFFLFEIPEKGAGSGVVIDKQGHVLTNFHVVAGARTIEVTLYNGKSYEAVPVGADEPNDAAVLKIDAPPDSLFPVTLGDSSRLRVGQRALAIGNPFGLERTLSVGVISSLNRPLSERRGAFRQLIQIDAAINPGNSGGPLLDSHGRMIGMNTVIASNTGQSAGVGFAIPINTTARILPDLIERGHVVRADVGIASVYRAGEGLLITKLVEGGAAQRAGLRGPRLVVREKRQGPIVYRQESTDVSAADLILALDGKPVRTADDLLAVVESKKPGDRVTVTVLREGRRMDVPVTLNESE